MRRRGWQRQFPRRGTGQRMMVQPWNPASAGRRKASGQVFESGPSTPGKTHSTMRRGNSVGSMTPIRSPVSRRAAAASLRLGRPQRINQHQWSSGRIVAQATQAQAAPQGCVAFRDSICSGRLGRRRPESARRDGAGAVDNMGMVGRGPWTQGRVGGPASRTASMRPSSRAGRDLR